VYTSAIRHTEIDSDTVQWAWLLPASSRRMRVSEALYALTLTLTLSLSDHFHKLITNGTYLPIPKPHESTRKFLVILLTNKQTNKQE